MLADLESGDWEFILAVLKREFGRRDNKFTKVVKLK